ncbi:DUF1819 family protein [Persicobacter sp. CCB-QB2]|uniref:DUF1819 family protein n=1 Tax=Persicobacter sp. CCB-QB2 TaxID=1561025 RepID=UPI0006A96010|nr:DUF1819 family protein [Persicobacter sp. CCB-QB2]
MNKANKYSFGITTASLRLPEFTMVMEYLEDEGDRSELIYRLGAGKESTGKKLFNELKRRALTLSEAQRKSYIHLDLSGQRQLAYLAVCRCYPFMADFVMEVLREKVLFHDMDIRESDYQKFLTQKTELYPEMERLSPVTLKSARATIFRILEEAGIIKSTREKTLLFQILPEEIINLLLQDNPEHLGLFFWGDQEILERKQNV